MAATAQNHLPPSIDEVSRESPSVSQQYLAGPSNEAVDVAWATVIGIVDIFLGSLDEPLHGQSMLGTADLASHMSVLRLANGGGLLDVLHGYVLAVLDRAVKDTIAPHFWSLLSTTGGNEGEEESESDSLSSPQQVHQRRAYGRVKRALSYVNAEVNRHLALVRLLDHAVALSEETRSAKPKATADANADNCGSSTHSIEVRYRCAFTAQVMAGATGDFHGTMRAFFDRILRFWHRSWLDKKRQRRKRGRGNSGGGGVGEGEDEMDVSDTDDNNDGEAGGGGGDGDMPHGKIGELNDDQEDEEEEESDTSDDEENFADVSREELLDLWGVLTRLGWFSLLQDAFTGVMLSHVLAYVKRRCDGVYDTPVLGHVIMWKDQVLLKWIDLLLRNERRTAESATKTDEKRYEWEGDVGGGDKGFFPTEARSGRKRDGSNDQTYGWAQRLGLAVHEAFCSARIAELFDIIADYPDSAVAVAELKTALGVTQQHQRLAVLLRESVRRRLLHPGANTHQIIDVYIATVKVLRVLDPKDILLETVAGPVRLYLQERKDTVRCIVASLTDETSGDLYEELRRQDARPLDRDDGSDEDDDGPVAPNWEPASRDADPSSGRRGGGDILSMLVSIYGSKELFVTEYRLMLADKLVNNLTYDTDRDVQNLELLKLRFGESSMHQCEIMVRDLEESKRVNANVHERLAKKLDTRQKEAAKSLDAVMVSQHFWPQLLGEDMKLHPTMEERLSNFSKAYSVIKNPRLLVWKKQLGVVQLTLDFGGVEKEFSVSPLHATLIMHFEGKAETWALVALAKEVDLPPSVVKKKMMLWVNQGIVVEVPGPSYRLVQDQAQGRAGSDGMDVMSMEENTEAAVSADANEAEVEKVIQQYLTGMLTNLGKLPINRIHNTLKMFMSGGDNKYEKSIQELSQFLWRLCNDGKLEQVDGEYRLIT